MLRIEWTPPFTCSLVHLFTCSLSFQVFVVSQSEKKQISTQSQSLTICNELKDKEFIFYENWL